MLRRMLLVSCALCAACSGSILDPPGAKGGGGGSGGAGGAGGPLSLPAGIRRLTDAEFDNSVDALFGIATRPSTSFATDTRQSGYTRNIDQRIDATIGDQIRAAAEAIGSDVAKNHLSSVVSCDPSAAGCRTTFITTFATRAFRRPATSDEVSGLGTVFDTAANGGSFADGVAAVVSAVLQSASFLYVPELGTGAGALTQLDPYETASALSYFLTAAPPDDLLLAAAAQNQLATPDQREAQARRLLSDPRAHAQVIRFVKEWLGLDQLYNVAKQPSDNFSSLQPDFDGETDAFVDDVVFSGDASLPTLLGADYTMADGALASFYGLSGPSGASFVHAPLGATPRRGLLAQASFLATHAGADYSSPVKRGVAILRRVLCNDVPLPTGDVLQRAMMTPPADAAHTTRQRFEQHATDPACAGCHDVIDPIGFAFEEFDEIGKYRDHENGFAIDSTGKLTGTDVDGSFANAAELSARLAGSAQVRRCFARNLFRFAAARTSPTAEDAFLGLWSKLPAAKQPSLIEILVSYVRSDLFVARSVMQ